MRRPPIRVGGARSFLGLVGLVVLTGCSSTPDAAPVVAATSSAPPSTSAPATTAAPVYELPEGCSGLLSLRQIDNALGTPLPGETTFTVGTPQPEIGRTGRVTCGFGVLAATEDSAAADPLMQLSVFTYTDAQAAADRVDATVDAQQAQGVRSDQAAVPGASAVLLSGPDETTLIATVDTRTYSLSLVPGVLDPAGTQTALQSLMGAVLAADSPAPEATGTGPASASPTG
ncbi:hypothetical protein GCU67_19000 [Modestobacter muralis]|uniref:DUF3558 domain-containing protein n=1 Tax=Modestobacter muralis TaxID=1608614 RepID=A0A6P0EYU7_9ACTN|nr:hypothetical protein [Modestobacter muralis]NEK96235.1 hypothetical protein [Modestobacter muralis]NEN53123.1 hypothetical protein [Modestobacter muralis]